MMRERSVAGKSNCMPLCPVHSVGRRVNVRNQAGGFLADDSGRAMSWPVVSITNGMAELRGRPNPFSLVNRWAISVLACSEVVS